MYLCNATSTQLSANDRKKMVVSENIINICKDKLDVSQLIAKTSCLCIDGTSSCLKTTILQKLEQSCYLVTKVQRTKSFINANSFGPSMLGYICYGLTEQHSFAQPHFNDRSFLNTKEWNFLWTYIERFRMIDEINYEEEITKFEKDIDKFMNEYAYVAFRQQMNGIAIINTNSVMVDRMRRNRNEGSDRERSNWKFYTKLQNIFYAKIYANLYIDLNWFAGEPIDTIVESLVEVLKWVLHSKPGQWDPDIQKNYHNISLKLPTPNIDLTVSNMETHVYRSFGRAIAHKAENVEEFMSNVIPIDVKYEFFK